MNGAREGGSMMRTLWQPSASQRRLATSTMPALLCWPQYCAGWPGRLKEARLSQPSCVQRLVFTRSMSFSLCCPQYAPWPCNKHPLISLPACRQALHNLFGHLLDNLQQMPQIGTVDQLNGAAGAPGSKEGLKMFGAGWSQGRYSHK